MRAAIQTPLHCPTQPSNSSVCKSPGLFPQQGFACVLPEAARRRLQLARQYGDSTLAYSAAIQENLKHFGDQRGFIAYQEKWGLRLTLGDPVTAPRDAAGLIEEFLQAGRRPSFFHVGSETAQRLADRGYYVNNMGTETTIQLRDYDFKGRQKEKFRYAANWMRRRGYVCREHLFDESISAAVSELSQRWMKTRPVKHREVGFLNRPLKLIDEPDVRKFFLFDACENLRAFVFFDPIYSHGQIQGYSTVIKRRDPAAPACAELGIMKFALDRFRSESVQIVRLGLSPEIDRTGRDFRDNPVLRFAWRWACQSKPVNRHLYNLQGHSQFKAKFRGLRRPVYMANPLLFSHFRLLALLRVMGII